MRAHLWKIIFLCAIAGIAAVSFRTYRAPFKEMTKTQPDDEIISAGTAFKSAFMSGHPTFEPVSQADAHLNDASLGIMYPLGSGAKFYPYQILAWRRMVQETVSQQNIFISYSPLCGEGDVFDRTVRGEILSFDASEKIWNQDFLLKDQKTGSLWSPVLGKAVSGVLRGTLLVRLPSKVMTWKAYALSHPNGFVLARLTGFDREDTIGPYGAYEEDDRILSPVFRLEATEPVKKRMAINRDGVERSLFRLCAPLLSEKNL